MKDITKYQGVFPAFYACYDAEGNTLTLQTMRMPSRWTISSFWAMS